jgi:hypothetical protein
MADLLSTAKPMQISKLLVLSLCAATIVPAVETKSWSQGEMPDFEKAKLSKLSLRSDGRLTLAPQVKELHDASTPYLWACAQDSRGNLYVGGGSSTGTTEKLTRIDSSGKATTIAELEGLEIHAIAIDRNDNIFAATAPDGKVYRIRNGGANNSKPEVFYDPKAKYIWNLVFAPNGDLYVATGNQGEIHSVTASGAGSVFFKTDETHIRSLAIDPKTGNLIAGTEPGGLILRIGPNGEGFVLHQSPKREVTAVAVTKDGVIWAAAAGNKGSTVSPAPLSIAVAAPASAANASPMAAAASAAANAARTPTPPPVSNPPAIQGGTELYRIQPDGFPRRVWQHANDIVYAIAFDAAGHPILGAGNKGSIYRIDSDHQHTLLVSLAPTQVTNLLPGRDGALFAVTGNIGKLLQIGPQLEAEGSIESEVLDAAAFTYWGRLSYHGAAQGVKFETRSGNLNTPQKNWSPWSTVALADNRGRVGSPSARFLQYRATLTQAAELSWVDIAYQSKNIAPEMQEIEVTPPNHRFPAPSGLLGLSSANTLSLPALGQRRSAPVNPADLNTGVTMNYAKGHIGVRWLARDDNGDTLTFKVEIKGAKETEWKLLKDRLRDKFLSWDSAGFADGEYKVRVTVHDGASNTPGDTLSAVLESEEVLIDNSGPQISALTAQSSGAKIDLSFTAKDAQSILTKAEYSINGGDWIVAEPTTRLSDSSELTYKLSIDKPAAGTEYTIAVRVTDEFDNQAVEKAVANK